MANDLLVVELKRLATELRDLAKDLHTQYAKAAQVNSPRLQARFARIAESWIANYSHRHEINRCCAEDYLADLSIHFQRLLTFSERATVRKKYDLEVKAILQNYTANLVIPVMGGSDGSHPKKKHGSGSQPPRQDHFEASAFVGHSFATEDEEVTASVISTLEAIGISVVTGEKPKADTISEKIKQRIEEQHMFVGVFTRKDKIAGKPKWTTSAWVIDEKAYAFARKRRLILLVEKGVESIGGIQSDYEYISFSRDRLHDMLHKILQLFQVSVLGLEV